MITKGKEWSHHHLSTAPLSTSPAAQPLRGLDEIKRNGNRERSPRLLPYDRSPCLEVTLHPRLSSILAVTFLPHGSLSGSFCSLWSLYHPHIASREAPYGYEVEEEPRHDQSEHHPNLYQPFLSVTNHYREALFLSQSSPITRATGPPKGMRIG